MCGYFLITRRQVVFYDAFLKKNLWNHLPGTEFFTRNCKISQCWRLPAPGCLYHSISRSSRRPTCLGTLARAKHELYMNPVHPNSQYKYKLKLTCKHPTTTAYSIIFHDDYCFILRHWLLFCNSNQPLLTKMVIDNQTVITFQEVYG